MHDDFHPGARPPRSPSTRKCAGNEVWPSVLPWNDADPPPSSDVCRWHLGGRGRKWLWVVVRSPHMRLRPCVRAPDLRVCGTASHRGRACASALRHRLRMDVVRTEHGRPRFSPHAVRSPLARREVGGRRAPSRWHTVARDRSVCAGSASVPSTQSLGCARQRESQEQWVSPLEGCAGRRCGGRAAGHRMSDGPGAFGVSHPDTVHYLLCDGGSEDQTCAVMNLLMIWSGVVCALRGKWRSKSSLALAGDAVRGRLLLAQYWRVAESCLPGEKHPLCAVGPAT